MNFKLLALVLTVSLCTTVATANASGPGGGGGGAGGGRGGAGSGGGTGHSAKGSARGRRRTPRSNAERCGSASTAGLDRGEESEGTIDTVADKIAGLELRDDDFQEFQSIQHFKDFLNGIDVCCRVESSSSSSSTTAAAEKIIVGMTPTPPDEVLQYFNGLGEA